MAPESARRNNVVTGSDIGGMVERDREFFGINKSIYKRTEGSQQQQINCSNYGEFSRENTLILIQIFFWPLGRSRARDRALPLISVLTILAHQQESAQIPSLAG